MFVHVTVPPTAMCTVCGLNAKFCIDTLADVGSVVVVDGTVVVVVVGVVPIVVVVVVVPAGCWTQPLTNTTAATIESIANAMIGFLIIP